LFQLREEFRSNQLNQYLLGLSATDQEGQT